MRALACDVWLRDADSLLALRVCYSLGGDDEAGDPLWQFAHCDVLRLEPKTDGAPAARVVSPRLGLGVYDVHRRLRDMAASNVLSKDGGIHELRLAGALTVAFPRALSRATPGLNANGGGVVSLDWSPNAMRTQIDRVFDKPDASLDSFEITEILAEDAKANPAFIRD